YVLEPKYVLPVQMNGTFLARWEFGRWSCAGRSCDHFTGWEGFVVGFGADMAQPPRCKSRTRGSLFLPRVHSGYRSVAARRPYRAQGRARFHFGILPLPAAEAQRIRGRRTDLRFPGGDRGARVEARCDHVAQGLRP